VHLRRVRLTYLDLRRSLLPGTAAIIASTLVALLLADALTFSRTRAIAIVYLAAALAAVAARGLLGLAQLFAATVPWLVVLGTRLPRLTETFAAASLAALVYLVAVPRGRTRHSFLLRLGIVCFYGPVLLSLAREGYGDQFIQAAKYAVFPTIVLAMAEATNHRGLASLASIAFVSGILAVGTNLALGLAGVSAFSTYGAGEILGLAGAHDLSLLAGCLTAASLAATASLKWWPATAVGAIATVATGVRSTLPGLAALAFARMVAAGARIRTIALVSLAVAAVFLSGAAAVIEARYRTGESTGEFESFSALGSGRGEVWSTAIAAWSASSPIDWFLGLGLRAIPRLEEEKIGAPFVGHSDLVEVGVQLGIIGLVGLILIWWVLISSARSKAPLIPILSFAVFSGALEYGAPLVLGVLLTAWHADEPQATRTAERLRLLRSGRRARRPLVSSQP